MLFRQLLEMGLAALGALDLGPERFDLARQAVKGLLDFGRQDAGQKPINGEGLGAFPRRSAGSLGLRVVVLFPLFFVGAALFFLIRATGPDRGADIRFVNVQNANPSTPGLIETRIDPIWGL